MVNKKKRKITIPLSYCRDLKTLDKGKRIDTIDFYSKWVDDKLFLFDLFVTVDKQYYVAVTEITNGYKEIDFDMFKSKYALPTLFDEFFMI